MKGKVAHNLLYFVMCSVYGAAISVIIYLFLKLMTVSQYFIWEYIPENFNIPFYTLIVCLSGGIIIGAVQTKFGVLPDEMNTVMMKVKKDKYYPYNNMGIILISALLPLVFGSSVGPEAGLTGVIIGLCYWVGDHLNKLESRLNHLQSMSLSSVVGIVFGTPLFGFAVSFEEHIKYYKANKSPKIKKIISNVICGCSAFGLYMLLSKFFGGGMALPKIEAPEITNYDRIWSFVMIIAGVVAGLIYVVSEKLTGRIFKIFSNKLPRIFSTITGGLVLGIIGTLLPLTMFSGEEQVEVLGETYLQYAPYMLIVIGVVKLMLTSVCIHSGFRGGHFFPIIFSGISIGYGMAMMFGFNIAFCTAVVTAGLMGFVMKKPVAVCVLLLLCFPIRVIPWLIISAFLAGYLPVEKIMKKMD